jgi:hypothetical protein
VAVNWSALRRPLLIGGYGAVLLAPLVLIGGAIKPGAQGRLVVFADALGFAGLSLLALGDRRLVGQLRRSLPVAIRAPR